MTEITRVWNEYGLESRTKFNVSKCFEAQLLQVNPILVFVIINTLDGSQIRSSGLR